MEEIKKQRDTACQDYLELYIKVDKAKELLKDLIKKNKYKIETDKFTYIFLEQIGDLKNVLDILERKSI